MTAPLYDCGAEVDGAAVLGLGQPLFQHYFLEGVNRKNS
jgi:hypothetical protein